MTRLRWNGPTDLEICIMSARSAQRTRRRRWRMGRDIAGEREMRRTHGRRVSGLEALVVEGEQRRLLLLPPFPLRTSSFIRTPKCFPPCCSSIYVPFPRPSQGLDPVRQLPSSSDAHGGLGKFGRQRQQQQDRPCSTLCHNNLCEYSKLRVLKSL